MPTDSRTFGFVDAKACRRAFIAQLLGLYGELTDEKSDRIVLNDTRLTYPVLVEELAAAVPALLSQEDAHGIYHMSGDQGGTMYGWAKLISERLGLETSVLPRRKSKVGNCEILPPLQKSTIAKHPAKPI